MSFAEDDIFTGMFASDLYINPNGFCFDILCTDEPIIDNPRLQGYNVDEKVAFQQNISTFKALKPFTIPSNVMLF